MRLPSKKLDLLHCPNQFCPISGVCLDSPTDFQNRLERLTPSLQSAIRALISHYSESDFTIQSFAQKVHLSTRQLERLFKSEIGWSPKDCLLQLRFLHAIKLARNENLSIKEAWVKAGFSSWGGFEYNRRKRYSKSIQP